MTLTDDYVTVKLMFFAKARELIGKKELFERFPSKIKGTALLNAICEKYDLKRLKSNVILAVNENLIDLSSDLILKETDEVAIIPPLSGGNMNFIKLTKEKLAVESIYSMVCSPEFGAVSLFVGTTRNNFEGQPVIKLEYEAYEQMAIKALGKLCQSIREKFDVGNIAIYHRLGDVGILEASVVIAISSTHRQSALNAVPFAIDALKASVPIWKKEIYGNGQPSEWKENSELTTLYESENNNVQSVHLYEEIVETDPDNEVPSDLIQVKANLQEINRRINSFIHRKREQINVTNLQNFFSDDFEHSKEDTCARVSAVLKRRQGSNSHLKVHRVANVTGPQTHEANLAPVAEFSQGTYSCPPGAEERLANAENYLNIGDRSKNVFARLKAIEDKIIFLESISPEYFHSQNQRQQSFNNKILPCGSKRTYSSLDLDLKMQELESKLQRKGNFKT